MRSVSNVVSGARILGEWQADMWAGGQEEGVWRAIGEGEPHGTGTGWTSCGPFLLLEEEIMQKHGELQSPCGGFWRAAAFLNPGAFRRQERQGQTSACRTVCCDYPVGWGPCAAMDQPRARPRLAHGDWWADGHQHRQRHRLVRGRQAVVSRWCKGPRVPHLDRRGVRGGPPPPPSPRGCAPSSSPALQAGTRAHDQSPHGLLRGHHRPVRPMESQVPQPNHLCARQGGDPLDSRAPIAPLAHKDLLSTISIHRLANPKPSDTRTWFLSCGRLVPSLLCTR